MRLLSVGSLPPRSGGPTHGGVATFHATLLGGLRQPGSGVEVVGVVPPEPLRRDIGLPVFTRPPGAGIADFYEELLDSVRPDAVLMNHFAHTIGVTHAHLRPEAAAVGIAHSWHSVTQRRGKERARATGVTKEAMSGLAALITGSRHCLREGEGLGFSYPSIAEVIHYPLQPFYAEALDLDCGSRRGVACLGSLVPRKNPLALVEAAVSLSGLEVTFAGHGELEPSLRELAAELEIADRVRVVHLADPEVRKLLLRSRVMCLPSRSETFGLAYIEALACGTPVVGFGPTIREIRDEMGIEIGEPLDSGDAVEIAATIEAVLAADWDRERLRRAAVETFGLGRASERYAELLRRAIRSAPSVRV